MFGVNLETKSNDIILDEELNDFLNKLKVDYTQFYRGIVIENLDPELKGRVKVRIPQIYGTDLNSNNYIATNYIPWATCAIQPAGNDSGTFLPPNIGDTVFVTFESGQQDYPIYFGGILTTRSEDESNDKGVGSAKLFDNKIAPVGVDDLPLEVIEGTERIIYKSLKGAIIYIDDKDGSECIKITDQSGQSIIMENLSAETLKRRGDTTGKNSRSQIVLTNSDGDSITLSHGKIHLKSANILFETDNFEQIGLDEFTDEINLADIILGNEQSTVTFTFTDMRTGLEVTETTSEIYKITDSGETLVTTINSGSYSYIEVDLSPGNYRAITNKDSYYESNIIFEVEEETSKTIQVFMTMETTEDNIQVVLTWNDAIPDMDSHTKVYSGSDMLSHIYYGNKDFNIDDINVVNLDLDDTDCCGPETTTINKSFPYTYLFYVRRYTGGYDLTTSNCNVKVYDKGKLVEDYNMPEGPYDTSYICWNVFSYDMSSGTINTINTITTSEPSL